MTGIILLTLAVAMLFLRGANQTVALSTGRVLIVSELRLQPGGPPARGEPYGERPAAPASAQPSLALPPAYRACTNLACQSWVNGSWDLWRADGDGSALRALTTGFAYDESPSWGSGCDLLAFSSTRAGSDAIYTMDGAGGNLRQLTDTTAREVLPALSPSGAEVVYQSYRAGATPELYLFGLSATAPARITNNSVYDGQPDWSPDGQRVAFISERSGAKNIWIMNRDGAGLRQVTFVGHAAAPKWSPDGARIAYASDDLGNGFTSLWVINVDGTGRRLVWRAQAPQTDAWADDWSYDGRYILYEEATWDYDDAWYITASSLYVINPDNAHDRGLLVGGGIHMAASWALCDQRPPVAELGSLPAIGTMPLPISWTGSDDCATQLDFQVQYRAASASTWTDWEVTPCATWTSLTQGQFAWPFKGQTFYFRVRARDMVGRVGDWAPHAWGAPSLLPAQVGGVIHDARGIPLESATVRSSVTTLPTTSSGWGGVYRAAAAGQQGAWLGVERAGYQAQRLARPGFDDEHDIHFYLAGTPELLVNGGFEAGQAAWYASNDAQFVTPSYTFDGMALQLGEGNLAGQPASVEPDAFGQGYVYQTLTIPHGIRRPTLGAYYVLGNGTQATVGQLTASISDGPSEHTLFVADRPTPWRTLPSGVRYPFWQYAYADLTPWVGRTITLRFQFQQSGGGGVLLDGISVAAWPTPAIASIWPVAAAPGTTTSLLIRGQNLSTAGVLLGTQPLALTQSSDTELRATISGGLPLGRYDVWVTLPGGYRSVLPAAFTVGGHAAIPFIHAAR